MMETCAMASMMAMPRRSHLNVLFQIFAFLNTKHNDVMVFDPTDPDIDKPSFVRNISLLPHMVNVVKNYLLAHPNLVE